MLIGIEIAADLHPKNPNELPFGNVSELYLTGCRLQVQKAPQDLNVGYRCAARRATPAERYGQDL